MTDRDFVYWLNGFIELSNPVTLTEEQVKIIKQHLHLVFEKVTKDFMTVGYSGYTC